MADDSIDVVAEGKKRIASQQKDMREVAEDNNTANRIVKQNKGKTEGIRKDLSSREMYGIMTTDPNTAARSRAVRESINLHHDLPLLDKTSPRAAARRAGTAKEYR